MLERLDSVELRYEELAQLLVDPEVIQDYTRVAEIAKERSGLDDTVQLYREYKATSSELEDAQLLADDDTDAEMQELACAEVEKLQARLAALEHKLHLLLLPKDPRDEKNVIIEVRAGAGGDEAGLFAASLYRMYTRYAERQSWKTEFISDHPTGIGASRKSSSLLRDEGRTRGLSMRAACIASNEFQSRNPLVVFIHPPPPSRSFPK